MQKDLLLLMVTSQIEKVMDNNLEKRIGRLEDIEEIKNVITRFARGADDGCNPEILRPLFSDTAVFKIGDFGTYEGGDEIVRLMNANNKTGFYWTLHYLVSPEIHIDEDGKRATAFYYLWEPAAVKKLNEVDQAYWVGGWYDAVLVKDNAQWRYQDLTLHLKLLSPNSDGWKPVAQSFEEI